jgi:hypothetical protein
MTLWHVTYSAAGDRTLFPRETNRRLALRTLGRVVGPELLLFRLRDGQLDVALSCSTERIGSTSSALTRSLASQLGHPADPPYRREIRTRAHLIWLLEHLLSEHDDEPLAGHPALRTGSCFPDLVGVRRIPGIHLTLHEHLPRLHLDQINALVGLPPGSPPPYDTAQLRACGTVRLARTAATVCCAPPNLFGRSRPVVTARAVTAALARHNRINTIDVAWALRLNDRTVRRLGAECRDHETMEAVRRYLSLEDQVALQLGLPPAPPPTSQPTSRPALQRFPRPPPLWLEPNQSTPTL